MKEAGKNKRTEIVHLYEKDIHHCCGCYSCWIKTPGKCIFEDDMTELLKDFVEADIIVFGTPLYHYTMSSIMKKFIERTLPLDEPWLIPHPYRPERTAHPVRYNKKQQTLLVSTCGFLELENFDSLVHTFRHYASMTFDDYIGEILCTYAEILSRKEGKEIGAFYLEKVKKAGKEIVENGEISDELKEELNKGIFDIDKETCYQLAEEYWKMRMEDEDE
jgi:multimeric flavodoxin WrbA